MVLTLNNNYGKHRGKRFQLDKYAGYLNFKRLSAYLFAYTVSAFSYLRSEYQVRSVYYLD